MISVFVVLVILVVLLGFSTFYKMGSNRTDKETGQTISFELDQQNVRSNIPLMIPSLYTAIIVEPREHKALEFVLLNFAENLNEDWNFILIHSSENAQFVKRIFEQEMKKYKHRVSFVCLEISKMTIKDYNCLFYDETFYDLIPSETFLIFQTDSIILRENKDNINDFFKYDYVGAPWPHTMGEVGYMKVGNGGLSLRKKSKMLELLKYKHYGVDVNSRQPYGKYIAEDQFFCGFFVKEVKVYKPFWEKAKQFSVEFVFYEKPFGIHACWRGLPKTELMMLMKLYPDVKKMQKLNQ